MRAQIINGALTASLKLAAHRERPDGTPLTVTPFAVPGGVGLAVVGVGG